MQEGDEDRTSSTTVEGEDENDWNQKKCRMARLEALDAGPRSTCSLLRRLRLPHSIAADPRSKALADNWSSGRAEVDLGRMRILIRSVAMA